MAGGTLVDPGRSTIGHLCRLRAHAAGDRT